MLYFRQKTQGIVRDNRGEKKRGKKRDKRGKQRRSAELW